MNRQTEIGPATYQDILDAPERMVAEVVRGALSLQPRPATPHAKAMMSLSADLFMHFERGQSGPGGWIILTEPELHFSKHDIVVPDLAGWRRETMPELEAAPYIETVPDWVCEVLSPSTRSLDLTDKRDLYAEVGVGHLWFVDPLARTLEAFSNENGAWVLRGALHGSAEVALAPFAAAPFDLANLWLGGESP